jgi:hypothetical protein
VAVEDGLVPKEPQEGQYHADLICNNNLKCVRVVQDEPYHADYRPDIGKQSLEASRNGVGDESEEGAMLVNNDGSIVGLWEGLMVVWREDVWLVVVLSGSETEIDDQLLSTADSEIGVDECYFLHSYIIN